MNKELEEKRRRIHELNAQINSLPMGSPLPDAIRLVREFVLLSIEFIDQRIDDE